MVTLILSSVNYSQMKLKGFNLGGGLVDNEFVKKGFLFV